MSFLKQISSNNYLYKKKKRISLKYINLIYLLITLYLTTFPYISSINSKILFTLFESIFIILFGNFYLKNSLKILTRTSMIYFYVILLSYILEENYSHLNFSKLKFTYCVNIISHKKINYIYLHSICYKIARYINKIIQFNLICLLYSYKNSILVKIEQISITTITFYIRIQKFCNTSYYVNINQLNIIMHNNILEKIISNFNNIYLGIKIKNSISVFTIIRYLLRYIHKFIYYLVKYKNNLNIVLYTRQIKKVVTSNIYI